MNQLTHNETSALIWAFVGLVAILVSIGWYYIQSSIRSQKEMSANVFAIRLNQAEHNGEIRAIKEDVQELKKDVQVLQIHQNDLDRQVAILKGKR